MKKTSFLLVALVLLMTSISAQTTKRVSFAKGANSATVKTSLVGKGYVDYIIGAKAGQSMTVELSPTSKAELVIVEPSGDIMPDAVGIGGFWGILDYSGDYKITVMLDEKSKKLKKPTAVSLVFKVVDNENSAQTRSVSAKEVTGTFETEDGANVASVLSIKNNVDGKNLQVELFASLKLGPKGEARGNTGMLFGFVKLEGDSVTFKPDGIESEECTITMTFVKSGVLSIEQEGNCGFVSDIITTAGSYKKKSGAEPKFTEN